MGESSDGRRATKRKAQSHFASLEQRDVQLWRDIEAEHAKNVAKNARLRALRLAKEAAEIEANPAPAESQPNVKPSRAPRAKPRMRRAPT